jgi:proline iminopeptidase
MKKVNILRIANNGFILHITKQGYPKIHNNRGRLNGGFNRREAKVGGRMKTIGIMLLALVFSLASCNPFAPKPSETLPISEGMKDVNGTRLYFKTIGTGDPIIFLHGSSGSHRYFLPSMEKLANSFQLVFYDQRGTGLSDGELDLSAITVDNFVEDLEALRAAFGFNKFSLIGHSWGAFIAIAYAIKYPSHLDKLILVDSIPVNNTFLIEFSKTLQQRIHDLSPEAQKMFTTTCTLPLAKLTTANLKQCNAIDATLRFSDPTKALTIDSTVDKNTAKNADIIQPLLRNDFTRIQTDIDGKLANVSEPTLIIHGDFDPIPAASSEYISKQIRSAQLVIIKNSGHFPFIEQPEQFFAAIRHFLSK